MSSLLLVWPLTLVRHCQNPVSKIRVIEFCFRSMPILFTLFISLYLLTTFYFLGHWKISRHFITLDTLFKVGEEGCATEMSFSVDCSMSWLIQVFIFCFLCIFPIIHILLLTSQYFSRQIIMLYSHVRLLFMSSLLNAAWNILASVHGVIGHLKVRQEYTERLKVYFWAPLLWRSYNKTSRILLVSLLSFHLGSFFNYTALHWHNNFPLWSHAGNTQVRLSPLTTGRIFPETYLLTLPILTVPEYYIEVQSKTKL